MVELENEDYISNSKNPEKTRMIEDGYDPDLVFIEKNLSTDEKKEAIKRCCGRNLKNDAEFWLLKNLWKAMRDPGSLGDDQYAGSVGEEKKRKSSRPIPLVIGRRYAAEDGFLIIPWNFEVREVCEVLEENLDTLRKGVEGFGREKKVENETAQFAAA